MGFFDWLFGDRRDRIEVRTEYWYDDDVSQFIQKVVDAEAGDSVSVTTSYYGVKYELRGKNFPESGAAGFLSFKTFDLVVERVKDGETIEKSLVIPEHTSEVPEYYSDVAATVRELHTDRF